MQRDLRSERLQGPLQAVPDHPQGGEEGTEYYTQVGTGNYNEKTARQYTDLSMMTCDDAIGRSAAAVFQALAMGTRWRSPRR